MEKFIVTYGDRVVLDYKNSTEGVYYRPEYFEIAVGKMGSGDWCRYSIVWSLDEIVKDVYKKFRHRFEMYKIYAVVS